MNHILLSKSNFIKELDYKTYDVIATFFAKDKKVKKSSYSIMIDIDEKSLKTLGQWPWPRIMMADLVGKIEQYHPAAIGLDIIFPEKDRTSPSEINSFYKNYFNIDKNVITVPKVLRDNDAIFANVLKKSNSVLGIYLSNTTHDTPECNITTNINIKDMTFNLKEYKYMLCNTAVLQENARYFGFINNNRDSDGILRRMPLLKEYNNFLIPSFSLTLISQLDPNIELKHKKFKIFDYEIEPDKDSSFLLSFYPHKWYKKISAIDILNGKVDASLLRGKIVLIGSSSLGLHDNLVRTNGVRTTGTKIHMTMLENLLTDTIVIQPSIYKNINIIISVLLTLLLLYLLIINKNLYMVMIIVTVVPLYMYLTWHMYRSGVYISTGYFYLPFVINFMLMSIAFILIENYKKRLFVEELDRSHVALLDSMVHVAEVHDIETGAHILRTKKYIKLLAQHIYTQSHHKYKKKLSPLIIEMMYRTAPLHDIGKVGIPDSILKKPGKLTFLEYEVMKTHPDLGRHIINNAMDSYEENEFFTMAKNIAYTHHEKWDGSGYPEGLKAEEIPLEGRMMALADVYDALVNKRVYKEAFSYEKVYTIIKEGKGTHFDPLLVEAFFEIKDEFKMISERYSDESGM
ncbi:CHASE2 domain-containing protein [Sulfurimonas sp.]